MTLQVTFKQATEAIPATICARKSPTNSSNVKIFLLRKSLLWRKKPFDPFRNVSDVYNALQMMNQHAIINTQYSIIEILAKQSSDILADKQRHLKSALESLETSKNAEGKAFAVYTCNPLAVLVGVVCSTFIIIDTHKVHEEVGGRESGLLVLFDLESIKKDDLLDGIVNWISLRMRRSIKYYSTKLHSLVLLQAKSENEFAISDTEDVDILNASIEIERHLQSKSDV